MPRNPFLGDMLATLFERRPFMARRGSGRSIEALCTALLTETGEISGIALATEILETYARLKPPARLAFFRFLNDRLELDAAALEVAASVYRDTGAPEDYAALLRAAEAPRQELLRRLNQPAGATAELVAMRVDLLALLPEAPELARTDGDFVHLLRSWFNRGFLVLRQISWDTPARILDKIVAYEAVHAIDDWDDLRRRLQPPDRRCFAYFHPAMPDEPLIFVEVALTRTVPSAIGEVLGEDREVRDARDTSVAVFYSISNCQAGLRNISFGNLLIKQVVGELRAELANLKTFVTLSPIPGLNRWLASQGDLAAAGAMLAGKAPPETVEKLAAHYLLHARRPDGAPLDPVARFHLGNGASIHAVHAGADPTENGLRQSSGAMVNYLYDLDQIEKNHEAFLGGATIPATKAIKSRADLSGLEGGKAPAITGPN